MPENGQVGQELTVEIWSDLICPWCAIGMARFERALATFPDAGSVRVVHRAFRLAPGARTEPVAEAIPRKYGLAPSQAGALFRRVESAARAEGLEFHLADTLHGDTVDGLRLVLHAASEGLQREVLERLHRAYFSQGLSLFDRGTLLDLVAEAGLDPVRARAVLESDAFLEDVLEDESRVREYGVGGVPFFLVDGRWGISGAQDVEVFAQALSQARGIGSVPAGDAEVCSPDGCEIP